MPIKLNQGADATIVTAATRAALAAVPQDYSRTFESVAESYEKAMASTGKMWGQLALTAGKIYKSIDDNAKGPQDSPDVKNVLNLKVASEMRNAIKETQRDISKTYNPLNFGPDNKQRRADLIKERNDRHTKLAHMTGNLKLNTTTLANSDRGKTNTFSVETMNALEQTRNGKTTDHGNYMVLKETKDKNLRWVMWHDPKRMAPGTTNPDGYPYPPSVKGPYEGPDEDGHMSFSPEEVFQHAIPIEITEGLRRAMREENYDEASVSGSLAMTEKLTELEANRIKAKINEPGGYAYDPAHWKERTSYGENSGMSWFEEMMSVSKSSANIFGVQAREAWGAKDIHGNKTLPSFDELPDKHPLREVPDTDKVPGLSEGDLENMVQDEEQYKQFFASLFEPSHRNYNAKHTGDLFAEREWERMLDARATGWSFSKNNPDNKIDDPDDPAYDPPYMKESRNIRTKIKKSMNSDFSFESLQGLDWSKKGGAKVIKENEDGIYLVYQKSGNIISKINPQNKQETLNLIYNNTDIRPGHTNIVVPKQEQFRFFDPNSYK